MSISPINEINEAGYIVVKSRAASPEEEISTLALETLTASQEQVEPSPLNDSKEQSIKRVTAPLPNFDSDSESDASSNADEASCLQTLINNAVSSCDYLSKLMTSAIQDDSKKES